MVEVLIGGGVMSFEMKMRGKKLGRWSREEVDLGKASGV